jgi:hypothetical protein
LLRKASTAQRFALARSLTEKAIGLARRAIARANPDLSPEEADLKFVEFHYGQDLASRVWRYVEGRSGSDPHGRWSGLSGGWSREFGVRVWRRDDRQCGDRPMVSPEILAAVTPVVEAPERLHAICFLGGSIASSAHGVARSTLDAGLVADLSAGHVRPFVDSLEAAYYVDARMISDAIARKSCFNVIHLATMFKVDVFAVKDREYDRVALARIRRETLAPGPSAREFFSPRPKTPC